MEPIQGREFLSNAIRYWEPRRILYNLVLAVIVVVHFVHGLPFSKSALQFNSLLLLFALAVLANVAYCAAYIPDVFAQMSGLRDSWLRFRWRCSLSAWPSQPYWLTFSRSRCLTLARNRN